MINLIKQLTFLIIKKRVPYHVNLSRLRPRYKLNENNVYGFKEQRFDSEIFEGAFHDENYLNQIKEAFSELPEVNNS